MKFCSLTMCLILTQALLGPWALSQTFTPLTDWRRPGDHFAVVRPSASHTDDRLVVNTNLVTLSVTVTDKRGRTIEGLPKDAFTVYDNDLPQNVSFFSDEDAPASVAIVFDVSNSMSGQKIDHAREALARFLATTHEHDEYFLVGFNSSAHLLLERSRDANDVSAKLAYVRPSGATAFYDAVQMGLEKLARAAYQKRALLIISDGQDTNSRHSFKEVRRALSESDVQVYSIGIRSTYTPSTSKRTAADMARDMAGEDSLKKLAQASGGEAHFPANTKEMRRAFEQIAVVLRRQYRLGYRPPDEIKKGEWRRIKVKVAATDADDARLVVRSREGYHAAK